MYGLWIISVFFPLAAFLVSSCGRQLQIDRESERIKCFAVLLIHRLSYVLQSYTSHAADSPGKVFPDDIPGNTDSLKNLTALIRLNSGNAHLGRDLDDTEKDRTIIVFHRCIIILIQEFIFHKLPDGGMGQIWIHRRSPIAQKGGKMMNLPGFSGFNDKRHGCTFSGLHQMLMH